MVSASPRLIVDPEFVNYLPGVSKVTDSELEKQLVEAGGAIDPVRVWRGQGIVVDGHRRLEKCQALGLPYQIEELEFRDREHVKEWMDRFQLGRRNLSAQDHAMVMARMEDRYRKAGEPHPIERVAKENNVSTRTVFRSKALKEAIEGFSPDIRERVVNGDVKASAADLLDFASYEEPHQRKMLADWDTGEYTTLGGVINGEDDTEEENATPSAKPVLDIISEAQKFLGKLNKLVDDANEALESKLFKAARVHLVGLGKVLEEWHAEAE